MGKRAFDIIVSLAGLALLSPLFIVLSIAIVIDSKGGIFYKQKRIGKNEKPFKIYKFRSMRPGSDKNKQLTVGNDDNRITKTGRFIRKYKFDELPQLINVFLGEMSIVGPRPEVPRYVKLYDNEQKKVLTVKPGLTDYASIEYANENTLLASAKDPEKTYIEEIMPAKLALNKKYIRDMGLKTDIKIILRTISSIFA